MFYLFSVKDLNLGEIRLSQTVNEFFVGWKSQQRLHSILPKEKHRSISNYLTNDRGSSPSASLCFQGFSPLEILTNQLFLVVSGRSIYRLAASPSLSCLLTSRGSQMHKWPWGVAGRLPWMYLRNIYWWPLLAVEAQRDRGNWSQRGWSRWAVSMLNCSASFLQSP